MHHSTTLAGEYLLSVSVNVLERYVSGLQCLATGSYCFMVAAIPSGPASVLSLVLRWFKVRHHYVLGEHCFNPLKGLLVLRCPLELNVIPDEVSQRSDHLRKSCYEICVGTRKEQEGTNLVC